MCPEPSSRVHAVQQVGRAGCGGGRQIGVGSLGSAPDRQRGGWADRLTGATFPRGPPLIGTDHKVSAMCHLMARL